MNGSLVIVLILSTLGGWLISRLAIGMLLYPTQSRKIFGITFHGILPKRKTKIINELLRYLTKQLFSQNEIQQKFISGDQFERLLPQIELHIDDFLRHRLGKKMPMIGMFIGENTIRQLKEVFMEELKEIFPAVMASYINGIAEQRDVIDVITQRINSIEIKELKPILEDSITGDLQYVGLVGAATGLIIGLIEVLIIAFVGN
jgi:uncharacterized membrane protein YheB (UPF0754 family)